jgi:hypothetical protein
LFGERAAVLGQPSELDPARDSSFAVCACNFGVLVLAGGGGAGFGSLAEIGR